MRTFWSSVVAFAKRVQDLTPITARGAFVLVAAIYAFVFYGLREKDLLLLVIGAFGIILAAVSTLVVIGTAIFVYFRTRHLRGESGVSSDCGVPATTGFSLPTFWFLPFVEVRWEWMAPRAEVRTRRESGQRVELIRPSTRGIFDEVTRAFVIADGLGLSDIRFRAKEKRSGAFHPFVGALKRVDVARSLASGEDRPFPGGPPEGERADLRRYAAGDPVRFILWKVFAKSRQVIVRTPEQAISPANKTLAYLVSGDADEAAAGAMRVAIETGAFGVGYTLGADGVPNVAKDRQAGLDLVTRSSVCLASEGGKGLDLFLKKEAMTAGSRVVVFVPARPGPWMDRVVGAKKALQGRGTTFEWIVCCDGILEERPRSRIARFLRADEPVPRAPHDAKTSSSELRSVIERLSTTRGSILYLDRLTGRIAPGSHCLPKAQS